MADTSRIEELRRRVQRDPASIAFAQLAEEYRRAGRCQEAIDTCESGLAHHPGYLSARVTLGRALLEIGNLEAAQLELKQVLRAAPENLAALRGLAEIHHRRGELQEALAHYSAALEFARHDPELEHLVEQIKAELEPPKPPELPNGLSFEEMKETFRALAGDGTDGEAAMPDAPVADVPDALPDAAPDARPQEACASFVQSASALELSGARVPWAEPQGSPEWHPVEQASGLASEPVPAATLVLDETTPVELVEGAPLVLDETTPIVLDDTTPLSLNEVTPLTLEPVESLAIQDAEPVALTPAVPLELEEAAPLVLEVVPLDVASAHAAPEADDGRGTATGESGTIPANPDEGPVFTPAGTSPESAEEPAESASSPEPLAAGAALPPEAVPAAPPTVKGADADATAQVEALERWLDVILAERKNRG